MTASPPRKEPDELLPFGLLATRQWLADHGMSRHRLDNALKSGKFVSLSRGVVARAGVPVTWQGLAASLHRMRPGAAYVGGITALEQAGLTHYLRSAQVVHLFSAELEPAWVKRLELGVKVLWHSNRRLWEPGGLRRAASLREVSDGYGQPYLVASPEQAYLEVLTDVPDAASFEHADQLMQGLTSLSPRRLDALLKACRHVKVKRLFFFFAERHRYPWLKHLDRSAYDLGSGKRVVASGGRLDREHLITVPEAFHGPE
jgi:hypothetical protein